MDKKTFGTECVERETGKLYGDLWSRYDDRLFIESVRLFEKRWLANGEPPDFFEGKNCLDAGCGGGRFTLAMSAMGAASVIGLDVSETGLQDAARRASDLHINNVTFKQGSVLNLPFPDNSFDFVCCSGVLHHTVSVERGLTEIRRVLKPSGSTYLLLYGSGGLFWSSNSVLRAIAACIGITEVECGIAAAGLPGNKRRTVLDDLFVPVLETYARERVEALLHYAGFHSWRYWCSGQLDHETSPQSMLAELEMRCRVWMAIASTTRDSAKARLATHGASLLQTMIATVNSAIDQHASGTLTYQQLRQIVVGHGHHRLIASPA